MRESTEKFNNSKIIKNIGIACNIKDLEELPHCTTVNNFLKTVEPTELETVIHRLIKGLIRSKAFNNAKIGNKYWRIIIDGTQIKNSRKPLDEKCLTKTHRDENGNIKYVEYYYYVLEAKLVLGENIIVSIASEFVENEESDAAKQDCELKACYRLMKKIKNVFPKLKICICADSLYAAESIFKICEEYEWKYIIRFKEGSIPTLYNEFETLKEMSENKIIKSKAERITEYNFVNEICYKEQILNIIQCIENNEKKETTFTYITNINVKKENISELIDYGRKRWKIENEGFNIQKNHGYELEHSFSKDYKALKNHYFLMQIAHMISQLFENEIKRVKEKTKITLKELHSKLLDEFKMINIEEYIDSLMKGFQIRFS